MALTDKLTAIANAIRAKTGKTEPLTLARMPTEIASISAGGGGSSADVRYVTFKNGTEVLYVKPVAVGDDCVDVLDRGLIETPTKESDAVANYIHSGWCASDGGTADDNVLKNITEDKTVYAAFSAIAIIASGTWGENASWTLDATGHAHILGEGETADATSGNTNMLFGDYTASVKKATVHSGITRIGHYLFNKCSAMESIDIPDSVVSIGNYAFRHCSSLKSITYPNSVTSVGGFTCIACTSLTSVTLSRNQSGISNYSFLECSALPKIVIPPNIKKIGTLVFSSCSALTTVIFEDPNGWWITKDSTATSGEAVDAAIVADPTAAAAFIKSHLSYYWRQS